MTPLLLGPIFSLTATAFLVLSSGLLGGTFVPNLYLALRNIGSMTRLAPFGATVRGWLPFYPCTGTTLALTFNQNFIIGLKSP